MIQLKRIQRILEHLETNEVLTVNEGVKLLGVSSPTIRRDFKLLGKEPFIQRLHGGIKLVKNVAQEMTPVELREIHHPTEKRALAERAARLLCPGDVVIIDGGTTTAMVSEFIPDFRLQVVTNSTRLLAALETIHKNRLNLGINITGGSLYPHSGILLGPTAKAAMSQYHAQWAFLSVGGITDSHIYNTNELVVEIERVMIDAAEKIVILADHSKIGCRAFSPVANLDDVDILITDEIPGNEQMLQKIEDAGVQVIRVVVDRLNPPHASKKASGRNTVTVGMEGSNHVPSGRLESHALTRARN